MKKKQIGALALAVLATFPTLSFLTGCSSDGEIVLRVYNWEEYIDEGGEGSYEADYEINEDGSAPSMIEDFEEWYEETYNDPIRVEYSTFGTNEDMYNQLKLGNEYDLLCPSDYMIMKLAAEDYLQPYTLDFFDPSIEENYYIRNVSPYIREMFDSNRINKEDPEDDSTWSNYAAGYMWGVTGFTYNPEYVNEEDLAALGWEIMTTPEYKNKVTTKDNVRDSYFVALGIVYKDEIAALDKTAADYNAKLTEIMNRTDDETIEKVEEVMREMDENIYGYETDTGKADIVNGRIWLNFAWSGDAVYAMDLAEAGEDEDGNATGNAYLNFFIPEECANLWFDGWVMPKGANTKAAQAFVNFLSMPENAVRNMYYIGYSGVIAGQEVFDYVMDTYSVDPAEYDNAEDYTLYDLEYFFGDTVENATFYADTEQATKRQLYTHYPPEEVTHRCAVMDYYGEEANENINELWSRIKGETLEPWAIAVICVGIALVVAGVLLAKFGGKIDFFRLPPKKGYKLVRQETAKRDK